MKRLLRDERGSSITEFAFLGPVFLMMIFLVLEGGRMMFTKQALNELATASARYASLHGSDQSAIETWAKARGAARSRLSAAAIQASLSSSTTCNGAPGMTKVTLSLAYNKGAMNLLPQSAVPSTLTSIGCFPNAV